MMWLWNSLQLMLDFIRNQIPMIQRPFSAHTPTHRSSSSDTPQRLSPINLLNPPPHLSSPSHASHPLPLIDLSRKKTKKKEYKRRKRDKKKAQLDQVKSYLRELVSKIYRLETTVHPHKDQLKELSAYFSETTFFQEINLLLRHQLLEVSESIEAARQELLPDNQSLEHTIVFLEEMIQCIYQHFELLAKAALQIRDLLECFLTSVHPHQPYSNFDDLPRSTIVFMVRQNRHILVLSPTQSLVYLSQQHREHFCPETQEELLIVNDYLLDDFVLKNDDNATISTEDEYLEESRKRKKKRHRIADAELQTTDEAILSRMDSPLIEDSRVECRVSNSWLQKVRHLIHK